MTEIRTTSDGKFVCPDCGNPYANRGIAQHWSKSSHCDYPQPSDNAQQAFIGLVLAGAGVEMQDQGTYPCLRKVSVNRAALEQICGWLGFWCGSVGETGRDVDARKAALREHYDHDPAELQTQYHLTTRASPYLKQVLNRAWDELPLTPVIGSIVHGFKGGIHARSAVSFRSRRAEELASWFRANGYVEASIYSAPAGKQSRQVVLSSTDSRRFFDRVDDPLPGFESKWAELREQGTWQGPQPSRRVFTDR